MAILNADTSKSLTTKQMYDYRLKKEIVKSQTDRKPKKNTTIQ